MRNINIDFPDEKPLAEQPVELVERKGIGHPDSICDGIAEAVSRGLSNHYLKKFGKIYHHNTDQVELVGGCSDPSYGNKEVLDPIYILLSGRATNVVEGEKIPVGEIAIKSAEKYLKENFKYFDMEKGVALDQKIGLGSSDLRDVFGRDGIPKSNDTSFGVSFAPFSLVEQLTYKTEKYINGEMEKTIPASGTDVKVMGVRFDDEITLTIANAFVCQHLEDYSDYESKKEEMRDKLLDFIAKKTDQKVDVYINTGDSAEHESGFITVTGTSAEMGDDGSVGRGNRANGLITPYRPMSLEATAGKNPVNHVGKIYNILSKRIADDIAEAGAKQAYVRLMSQIGKPIDKPLCASVQVIGDKSIEAEARRITDYWLENVIQVTDWCVKGKAETF
ncbi:MAG: methionine adenosyltransferase [Candidatus Altiarchaeota archaeon]